MVEGTAFGKIDIIRPDGTRVAEPGKYLADIGPLDTEPGPVCQTCSVLIPLGTVLCAACRHKEILSFRSR